MMAFVFFYVVALPFVDEPQIIFYGGNEEPHQFYTRASCEKMEKFQLTAFAEFNAENGGLAEMQEHGCAQLAAPGYDRDSA